MKLPSFLPRMRGMGAACGLALLLCTTLAAAANIQFGKRSLNVPTPEHFAPSAATLPMLIVVLEGYLPKTNRLVEAYLTPEDLDALSKGQNKELDRYFQLQVARNIEGVRVPDAEFEKARDQIEAGVRAAFDHVDTLGDALMRQGNEKTSALAGKDVNASLSGTGYLGTFRREPWGLFFSARSSVAVEGQAPTLIVMSGAAVQIDGQVLYLYAYSHYRDEKDRQWTADAVSRWADAIHAANAG